MKPTREVYLDDKPPVLRVNLGELEQDRRAAWMLTFDKVMGWFCYGVIGWCALYLFLWVLPKFAIALWEAAK